jgi:hypothetical protein
MKTSGKTPLSFTGLGGAVALLVTLTTLAHCFSKVGRELNLATSSLLVLVLISIAYGIATFRTEINPPIRASIFDQTTLAVHLASMILGMLAGMLGLFADYRIVIASCGVGSALLLQRRLIWQRLSKVFAKK